jgi:hypothetical protein
MLHARIGRAALTRSPLGAPPAPRSKRRAIALSAFVLMAALAIPMSTSAAAPQITLSKTSGPTGTIVVVRGAHFPASRHVQITFDGHYQGMPVVLVGRTGSFKVSIRIPGSAEGAHQIGAYRLKDPSRRVRVTSRSQLAGRLAFANYRRTRGSILPPPPSPASSGHVYGSMATDTKANIHVGGPDGERVAHRFVASTTSALTAIRFAQRGGSGYSGGNGGTMRISVQTDNGHGAPSGTRLASLNYSPGNPGGGWWTWLNRSFPSPATLTTGHTYYIVFENIDPSPQSNYISVNELFVYGSILSPRQPMFGDSSYAVLIARPSWQVAGNYTATMDLTYANGRHDGLGYIEAMVGSYVTASGSSEMFREHFKVSGSSRTVTTAAIRVRRSYGSSPLTIRLETGGGSLIEQVTVSAASIAASAPGGDNGGSEWAVVHFRSPHVLAKGSTYNLRASTDSGTAYTTIPLREGEDFGMRSYTFADGDGQVATNGSNWRNIYQWAPVDIQFYLK